MPCDQNKNKRYILFRTLVGTEWGRCCSRGIGQTGGGEQPFSRCLRYIWLRTAAPSTCSSVAAHIARMLVTQSPPFPPPPTSCRHPGDSSPVWREYNHTTAEWMRRLIGSFVTNCDVFRKHGAFCYKLQNALLQSSSVTCPYERFPFFFCRLMSVNTEHGDTFRRVLTSCLWIHMTTTDSCVVFFVCLKGLLPNSSFLLPVLYDLLFFFSHKKILKCVLWRQRKKNREPQCLLLQFRVIRKCFSSCPC